MFTRGKGQRRRREVDMASEDSEETRTVNVGDMHMASEDSEKTWTANVREMVSKNAQRERRSSGTSQARFADPDMNVWYQRYYLPRIRACKSPRDDGVASLPPGKRHGDSKPKSRRDPERPSVRPGKRHGDWKPESRRDRERPSVRPGPSRAQQDSKPGSRRDHERPSVRPGPSRPLQDSKPESRRDRERPSVQPGPSRPLQDSKPELRRNRERPSVRPGPSRLQQDSKPESRRNRERPSVRPGPSRPQQEDRIPRKRKVEEFMYPDEDVIAFQKLRLDAYQRGDLKSKSKRHHENKAGPSQPQQVDKLSRDDDEVAVGGKRQTLRNTATPNQEGMNIEVPADEFAVPDSSDYSTSDSDSDDEDYVPR